MIIERNSSLKLSEVEGVLRRAARRRRASISAVEATEAGMVFSVAQPDLYARLLASEARFAAFLPVRIAACLEAGAVKLVAASPVDFCRCLERHDLEELAGNVETVLREILDEAARPAPILAAAGAGFSAIGATEDQVNMRGALPQRIDNRGSKLEEIAGTGQHDSPGG
jgi:hypothetical protein